MLHDSYAFKIKIEQTCVQIFIATVESYHLVVLSKPAQL